MIIGLDGSQRVPEELQGDRRMGIIALEPTTVGRSKRSMISIFFSQY